MRNTVRKLKCTFSLRVFLMLQLNVMPVGVSLSDVNLIVSVFASAECE